MLSNIEPPQIRRDRATLQEYKKAQQLTDRVPIKEILREPPMSRLRSRRPFVAEAARLANLNQTEQDTWKQSWIQGVPPGHDLVTDPTCPQPGFTLPRRSSSHWIVWDVARPDAPNLSTDGVWSHHLLAPAERATRPQGALLKSAHSLHSLEACNDDTKRILMQWNGCQDCHWNCESVPNEQH